MHDTSSDFLNPVEQQALALSQAAVRLDQARQKRQDATLMHSALAQNVELWVGIQTMVKHANGCLPDAVKSNLHKLGNFVIGTTFKDRDDIEDRTLDTLININLQISEGLLEGQAR